MNEYLVNNIEFCNPGKITINTNDIKNNSKQKNINNSTENDFAVIWSKTNATNFIYVSSTFDNVLNTYINHCERIKVDQLLVSEKKYISLIKKLFGKDFILYGKFKTVLYKEMLFVQSIVNYASLYMKKNNITRKFLDDIFTSTKTDNATMNRIVPIQDDIKRLNSFCQHKNAKKFNSETIALVDLFMPFCLSSVYSKCEDEKVEKFNLFTQFTFNSKNEYDQTVVYSFEMETIDATKN